ncbi:hypothetical protein LENED_000784 [Lentinula edodes]|uniref:Uncharacterized protein n=1 Tax=Lentinula edodes TaxID=5353 RepID=A0A1Q3DWG0_LENED|nr:hypothetical protein LENED_000784 [Lentinula edodes]
MHSTLLPIDRPTSYIKVAASPHFSEHGYESEFTNTSKVIKTRNHLRLSRGLCFDAPYVILSAPYNKGTICRLTPAIYTISFKTPPIPIEFDSSQRR